MTVDSTNAMRLERKESKKSEVLAKKSGTKLGKGGEMAFPDVVMLEEESKQKTKVLFRKDASIERFHYEIEESLHRYHKHEG